MRNVLVIAHLLDDVDDVVGKFLRAVIGRRVESGFRTIIVDRHAPADIEQVDRHFHLMDLGVDARGFFHRVLDALDVRQLRSDVKVQQPQHVDALGFFHLTDDFEEFRRRQAELGSFAARFLPAARTF